MKNSSIVSLLDREYSKPENCGLRFGQWFVNTYIKREDNDQRLQGLYSLDGWRARWRVIAWCIDHGYTTSLPQKLH